LSYNVNKLLQKKESLRVLRGMSCWL
jgi:hypothetical protein